MTTTIQSIPDGLYTVRIEQLTMKRSKKGDPMLEWHCVIPNGEYAGVHFVKRSVLITPKAKQFTMGEFQKLSILIRNADDLRNRRASIEGMTAKFNIVTDENGNIAFYVHSADEPPSVVDKAEEVTDLWNTEW